MTRTTARLTVVLAAIAGLTLLTASAKAQTTPMPSSQADFEKQLGITPDQKQKMQAVDKKYNPQLQAISKKYQPQAQKLQQQMMAIQEQMQTLNKKAMTEAQPYLQKRAKEYETILTPAQRDKIKQLQQQAMQQRQMMMGGGAPGMAAPPKQ
jgi:hypothetical protein